ncbi:MAG: SPASM domain-containing protein, partial [Bacteroidota bacterium]
DGAKTMVAAKKAAKSKGPHIVFQFLVVRPNEHQINDVQQLAKEIGVDEVKFKTAQIYDYENGNDLIPTIDKYSRYRPLGDGRFAIKNKLLDHCWKMWHSCVITWDGKVVPCCFDKDAHYVLGDCNQQSFTEIWNSQEYHDFRQQLFKSRNEIEMCRNCTEGTKVWA